MGRWQTNFRALSQQDCQALKLSDLVIKILLMAARSNLFWHQTQKKFTRYGDSTYFYFTCLCLFYIRQNRPKINDVLIVLKLPVHLGVSLTVRLSFKVLFQDHASLTPWLRGRKWVLTTIMELFGSVFEPKRKFSGIEKRCCLSCVLCFPKVLIIIPQIRFKSFRIDSFEVKNKH